MCCTFTYQRIIQFFLENIVYSRSRTTKNIKLFFVKLSLRYLRQHAEVSHLKYIIKIKLYEHKKHKVFEKST